jgi:hypothetical protein
LTASAAKRAGQPKWQSSFFHHDDAAPVTKTSQETTSDNQRQVCVDQGFYFKLFLVIYFFN